MCVFGSLHNQFAFPTDGPPTATVWHGRLTPGARQSENDTGREQRAKRRGVARQMRLSQELLRHTEEGKRKDLLSLLVPDAAYYPSARQQ